MRYIKHIIPAKGNALAYKEIPPHVYSIAAYFNLSTNFLVKLIDLYLKMIKTNL